VGISIPTLVGQAGTFLVFILFTMKFVWPHIMNAIQERQEKIAEGLAAAEKGVKDLEEARAEVERVLKEAREQASDIIAQANRRSTELVEEAKNEARAEGERLVESARGQIEQEVARAREQLRDEVAALAATGAGQILGREVNAKAHGELLDKLAAEL
jgi:F-type H+-transporting ATPase subunit b